RGTAPIPIDMHALEKELAELKKAVLQKERAAMTDRLAKGQEAGADLPFYDALKETPDTPAARRKSDAAPVRTPSPPKAAPSSRKKANAPPVPPAPAPSANDMAQDQGRYAIQVAAFKDNTSADRMVAALRAKGYPAYHVRMPVKGKGMWFRVRIGAFKDRRKADEMHKRLGRDQIKGLVVQTQ
ncbi:MAG: SPOR domain-containing protein, partial [Desulfatitalea sp.]|nr:SPOR domain-containing protein [Desulfatitalea sp.]